MACKCIYPFDPDPGYCAQGICVECFGVNLRLLLEYLLDVEVFIETHVFRWEEDAKAHEGFAKGLVRAGSAVLLQRHVRVPAASVLFVDSQMCLLMRALPTIERRRREKHCLPAKCTEGKVPRIFKMALGAGGIVCRREFQETFIV